MEGSMLGKVNIDLAKGRVSGSFVRNAKTHRAKREFYEQLEKRNDTTRAQYAGSKEFKELRIEDVPTEYLHPKESQNLLIIHYPLADQDPPKGQQSYFTGAMNASLNLEPERDESGIFDSAWATLRGERDGP